MAKNLARAAAFVLVLLACAVTSSAQAQPEAGVRPNVAPPLKISSGDLLEVTVFENPDLSGHFRVDEKGQISMPLIGQVNVLGDTAEEAAAKIEKRFVDAQILQPAEAHATVFIAEYATQGITLNGEVKSPGVYPALGVRMLNDVIASAGGLTQTAATDVIITHRSDPGHQETVQYDPSAQKPIVPQVQIFPGDSIFVPKAGIVYVIGAVLRVGGYVLDNQRTLTVEKAMALAGGSGRAAALNHVQLVRTLSDGRKEAITIPLDKVLNGKAPDVAMKDGDVLYVPTSAGKLVGEQAINAALGIGTAFAIYKLAYQ
jgi:polysaccharide export outer membrane protein